MTVLSILGCVDVCVCICPEEQEKACEQAEKDIYVCVCGWVGVLFHENIECDKNMLILSHTQALHKQAGTVTAEGTLGHTHTHTHSLLSHKTAREGNIVPLTVSRKLLSSKAFTWSYGQDTSVA